MKTDPELGQRIHKHLLEKGVETPLGVVSMISNEHKRILIEKHFGAIMGALGLDCSDDSLRDTPRRVAKMYVDEIFYGLDYNLFPKATVVDNKMGYDEMVIEKNVSVQSNCEHHFVIISGKAAVAYFPDKSVLGLSKINRIVEFFSKRPSIQERLTEQIFHALCFILGTEDVAVTINAEHYCVKSRGVRDEGSSTITSRLGGRFLANSQTRAEFFSHINHA